MIVRRRINWLIAIVAILVGSWLTVFQGAAANSCLLEFSQPQTTVDNLVNVDIAVKGNVAIATLWIEYDREMLQLVSTSGGICVETENGLILDAEHSSQGDLSFSICFKALRSGTAQVICTRYDVVDGEGESLECSGGISSISIREGCTNGHRYQNGTCSVCGDPYGAALAGTMNHWSESEEKATLTLWDQEGRVYETQVGSGYYLSGVVPGTYTLQVEQSGCVTRQYSMNVGDRDLIFNVSLSPLGDVNEDGKVTVMDLNRLFAHVNGSDPITDPYVLSCSDTVSNGSISVADLNRLYAHIAGENPLL